MTDTKWLPTLSDVAGPKFRALANALRDAARSGELPPGTRLPAVRDLAWRLGITPGTVARAYQIAAAEGVLDSHVGRGSFIAQPRPRIGPLQPMLTDRVDSPAHGRATVDLRIPQLPDCGQTEAIRSAMIRAAQRIGDEVLDYPSLTRDRTCRAALCRWLSERGPGSFGPDDLVLTHGGQNAIVLVMSLCLSGERPRVLCESLAYPGLRHAARLLRADIQPVALDEQGMVPDDLDHAARSSGAQLVCLTPSAQNPTVARMGAARRHELIAVARRHDLQIIEDDCFSGPLTPRASHEALPSLRSLAPERVWQVSSLSKILSAGLRFGFVICPEGMGAAGRLAAQHSHFGLSLPLVGLVTELIESGTACDLAQKVQAVFDDRVALAQQVLAGTSFVSQPGVPFLWLNLPMGWRGSTFATRTAESGVLVRSADEFSALGDRGGAAPAMPNAVRIALPCKIDRALLSDGLKTVARLYHTPPGDLPV
ncbi:MAG: PLP-dependent aminotransferase family protein [Paracoccus sp. (in: a-proteobacteria)]|uniref:aminotransferase-like domain-containing protein n=1 Tax=Paracoccus sp. TaxID=267 RepID=UPI0026DFB9FE|nr:PLP-dependent aminotransferase family protein [Paracoccus sp. (in: a-proteobacteria)]MDO5612197.1 PLP-dependent aminotransferase family protein [Paracoccus sp. (in: a-proteobacteria)]